MKAILTVAIAMMVYAAGVAEAKSFRSSARYRSHSYSRPATNWVAPAVIFGSAGYAAGRTHRPVSETVITPTTSIKK